VQIRRQIFSEITYQPDESAHVFSRFDGVLGLNVDSTEYDSTTQLFANMIDQGVIEKGGFAVWLSKDPSDQYAGELSLGTINKKRYTGKVTFTELVKDASHWEIPIAEAKLGTLDLTLKKSMTALFDTTTPFFFLPEDSVDAIHDLLKFEGNAELGMPCDTLTNLPDLEFTISGNNYLFQSSQYITQVCVFTL
jgi:hypothetical protein